MGSIYDRAEIYDLLEDESHVEAYRKHWETIFAGRDIKSMLDVSIGSGSVTLPALDLGIELSGSDLSEAMLSSCAKKLKKLGRNATLKCSDFRDLSCFENAEFDMVASTGNSLAYVDNTDIQKALEQMDKHVKKGGYLYFDLRNWEKIQREHQRFYLYNPIFDGENRINLIQVWDYNPDSTITFNLLFTFEKDNKIFQKEKFEEHYYPVSKDLLLNKLKDLGYEDINIYCFPSQFEMKDLDKTEWYSVVGRKAN